MEEGMTGNAYASLLISRMLFLGEIQARKTKVHDFGGWIALWNPLLFLLMSRSFPSPPSFVSPLRLFVTRLMSRSRWRKVLSELKGNMIATHYCHFMIPYIIAHEGMSAGSNK
jgi:hypothetical protein